MSGIIVTQVEDAIIGGRGGYFKIMSSKGVGVVDARGYEIIKPYYVDVFISPEDGPVEMFVRKRAVPWQSEPLFDLINTRCETIKQDGYGDCVGFREGVAVIKDSSSIRCIDRYRDKLFEIRDDSLRTSGFQSLFHDGLLRISSSHGYYYVSKRGKKVTDTYEWAGEFHNNRAVVGRERILSTKGNIYGVIDKEGMWKVRPKYDDISDFSRGLAAVCLNGKKGFIDINGNVVIPLVWDTVTSFGTGGLAFARANYPMVSCMIDASGKQQLMLPLECQYARSFSENMLAAKGEQGWGYIDREGKWVIAPEYDEIGDFSDGVAPVCKGEKWSFIDSEGKEVMDVEGCLHISDKGLAYTSDAIYDYRQVKSFARDASGPARYTSTLINDLNDVLVYRLINACGAPGHDYYFRNNPNVEYSILEMINYGSTHGIEALLEREYPDTSEKNIIVNIIDKRMFITDGNRHCVALLALEPELTIARLNELRPGLVRIWFAGVEEGRNTPDTPYDVYIPANIDISRVPGARLGTDWFKDPPAPTNIVPGDFQSDSKLLDENDRGCPLFLTVHRFLDE